MGKSPTLPPRALLVLLFLLSFAAYSLTLGPSLYRNDSPETITACVTLGVSHAPGYPFHSLLGRLFSFLCIANPALTLNLFSAVLSALAVCLFAVNLWLLIPLPYFGRLSRPAAVLAGSLLFACSPGYWNASLSAKGGIYAF